MKFGSVGPVSVCLPETVEDNDMFAAEFPKWNMELIYAKTGVRARHIAGPTSVPRTWRSAAAEKLVPRARRSIASRSIFCCCARRPPTIRCPPPPAWCRTVWGLPTSARGARLQPGLLGLRLRPVAGRRADPQRRRTAGAADHGRDLLEVHPSDRPLAADDLRRRRRRDADRRGRRAVARLLRVRHRRQRGRDPDGHRRRRPARRPGPRTAEATTLAEPALHGRAGLVKFTVDVVPPMIERVLARRGWTPRRGRFLPAAPGHHLPAGLSSASGCSVDRRAGPPGTGRVRQHRLLDDSHSHSRPAVCGPAAARREDPDGRLRRGALVGRLRLDRDLARRPGLPWGGRGPQRTSVGSALRTVNGSLQHMVRTADPTAVD